jgi:hypothetical protein
MLIISSVEAARGAEFQYGPPDPTGLAVYLHRQRRDADSNRV